MFKSKPPKVNISIPRKALEAIFDECDRYDVDETGGRIVGTYRKNGNDYRIDVLGVIDPGPNAKRSPTSFFQDGEYQERVFREIEKDHPNLEHLGNWHTHHVNGLQTLSSGDRVTYHRTVNHDKHNTAFFYALLVTRKTSNRDGRYEVRHYILFRGDDEIHELPESQIHVVEASEPRSDSSDAVFTTATSSSEIQATSESHLERVKDQEFFSEFCPGLKAAFSKSAGTLFWRGPFALVDGSHAEILAMENSANGAASYSITIMKPKPTISRVLDRYKDHSFRSARQAVWHLVVDVNSELYRHKRSHG
jgi:hypothetical protein